MDESRFSIIWIARKRFEKSAAPGKQNPASQLFPNRPPFVITIKKGIDMAEIAVGDLAPAFELPQGGGGTLSLSAYRGKPVVLYFYPKDDTSGCTAEAIAFSGLKPQFEKAGATVIGMSPDSVKSHDKFRTKHGLAVELVSDEDKEVLEAYGVWTEKSMYGRKYMGVERTTFLIGADGKVAHVWRKVKVPGHAEEVLKAVEAL
jgi:peroxiredoxin Q/BCP